MFTYDEFINEQTKTDNITNFIKKVVNSNLGIISHVAKASLDGNSQMDFMNYLGDQSFRDAPESTKKALGNDIFNSFKTLYKDLNLDVVNKYSL